MLKDKIAVVAGATRGAGRGIALELGSAGAVVYVTGRTSKSRPSEYNRPETIEESAELVDRAGGNGIAVCLDHTDPGQVESLTETIRRNHGRLDILVNDIWGGEGKTQWDVPIWEQSLSQGIHVLRNATESHIITNHYLLKLLIQHPGGVLFEVSDGTLDYNLAHYRCHCLFYDLSKIVVNRMAWSLSIELAKHRCTSIGITPGWLRSEMMLDHFHVTEENWQEAILQDAEFINSETPRFVGRAIAHLSADPDVSRFNGRSLTAYDVSQVYGFTDLDGRQPDCWGAKK
ncbi:MAG: SDR family oxidoreductase [Candidatus Aminicenantes bacterium]|nr:SDR family oxidoreductase [Candidatus Aminicenantes bacterium]